MVKRLRVSAGAQSFLCGKCDNPVPLAPRPTDEPVDCPSCGHTYFWDDGILLLDSSAHRNDYPDDAYTLLAEVEPRHFWFSGRNRLILSTMREVIGPLEGRCVLDVGCGTGFVLAALERAGMVGCGIDMHIAGLRYARERTQALLLCGTATGVPFDAQFDVVTLCDVIEHTLDDEAPLRAASQALKDDGVLIVTVPAHPSLWTPVDEAWGHKRRYTKEGLAEAMVRAGLRVRLVRYFNALLFLAQALQRQFLKRRLSGADADHLSLMRQALRVPPAPLNALLHLAMTADIAISRLSLPFGTSLIAIGYRT